MPKRRRALLTRARSSALRMVPIPTTASGTWAADRTVRTRHRNRRAAVTSSAPHAARDQVLVASGTASARRSMVRTGMIDGLLEQRGMSFSCFGVAVMQRLMRGRRSRRFPGSAWHSAGPTAPGWPTTTPGEIDARRARRRSGPSPPAERRCGPPVGAELVARRGGVDGRFCQGSAFNSRASRPGEPQDAGEAR